MVKPRREPRDDCCLQTWLIHHILLHETTKIRFGFDNRRALFPDTLPDRIKINLPACRKIDYVLIHLTDPIPQDVENTPTRSTLHVRILPAFSKYHLQVSPARNSRPPCQKRQHSVLVAPVTHG